ncbi:hypothetical protein HY463_00695 [Candidatus Peregrinibacteria bacterium]|nr:hypothetical protein [Candidatus Peregrinibacteria bacterium]
MLQIDQVRTAIDSATPEQLKQIAGILGIQESTREQVAKSTETVELDPRLTKFAEMYNRWSATSKRRLDWPRVQAAMLADDGALLKQVEALPNGPIMFGADKAGNILFANGGVEPILTGTTYSAAGKAAQAIGLDLFPYKEPYKKSAEELMFEAFTGEPLVRSKDRLTWRSSYLDNGENDANVGDVRISYFDSNYQRSHVSDAIANHMSGYRGVRGLLRAKA